jgi:sugar lactone lactonase YvrE
MTASFQTADLGTLASGLDHPEGVALGPDGNLYAGGEAGQVYRIDPSGGHEQIANTTGSVLGVCLDAGNSIYLCDPGNHAVMRIDGATGSVDRWCESAAGAPLRVPNWAAFARDGSMWLSDSGTESLAVKDGRLLRSRCTSPTGCALVRTAASAGSKASRRAYGVSVAAARKRWPI